MVAVAQTLGRPCHEQADPVGRVGRIGDRQVGLPARGGGEAQAQVDLSLPFRQAKARVVEEFERAYVQGLLESHGGKLTAAAKHADMDPKNFSDKMARYGLKRQPADAGEGGPRAS